MKCCAPFNTPTHHNATQTLLAATAGIKLLASTRTSLLENMTLHYVFQGEVNSYYNSRMIQLISLLVRQFSWTVALIYICCYSINYQVFSYVAILARLQKVSGESETSQGNTKTCRWLSTSRRENISCELYYIQHRNRERFLSEFPRFSASSTTELQSSSRHFQVIKSFILSNCYQKQNIYRRKFLS